MAQEDCYSVKPQLTSLSHWPDYPIIFLVPYTLSRAYEDNIINYQGNVNQNHNEITLHTTRMTKIKKTVNTKCW